MVHSTFPQNRHQNTLHVTMYADWYSTEEPSSTLFFLGRNLSWIKNLNGKSAGTGQGQNHSVHELQLLKRNESGREVFLIHLIHAATIVISLVQKITRVCLWVWVRVLRTPCFLSWLDNTQQLDGRWQVAHTWSTVKVVPSMFHGWSILSYPDHIPAQLHIGYRIQLSTLYVTLPSKWVTVIPFVILR